MALWLDASILDERVHREVRHPGSSDIETDYIVEVPGKTEHSRETQEAATYRAEHEAVGEVTRIEILDRHLSPAGDSMIYQVRLTTLRYW